MNNRIIRIKLILDLDPPETYSPFTIGINELLQCKDDEIGFKYYPEIMKDEILSISKYTPVGIDFLPWIKIEFMKSNNIKEIYITSRRFLGLGYIFGDNERIENQLRQMYLNK